MMSQQDAKVRYIKVGENAVGQRIDNFLLTYLKGVPRSWVYRILRRGEVRVNKGRAKPTRRLRLGDQVRVPPLRLVESTPGSPTPKLQTLINHSIVYEDERLLVINKPSGIAVHGGSGVSHGVIETLRSVRPQAPYLELAHRLDRDTSGCLLLAKKRSALRQLQQLQLNHAISKHYLALLAGKWCQQKRKIDVALRKNTLQGGERVVRVDPAGKAAVTHFTVRQRFDAKMLVEARLETGRTHQIRVHAAHAEAPILGDEKYGDVAANQAAHQLGLNRLFLHAWKLEFDWPERGKTYQFEVPLPAELQTVLDELG